MNAEMSAYKTTIEELEGRVLEAKMENKVVRSPSQSMDFVSEEISELEDGGVVSATSSSGVMPDSGSNGLSLETLRDESIQLKSLLEEEITSLEQSLSTREEEAHSANLLAAEYATKYSKLKEEFDAQIQRLVLKLSLEQQARADVEERIDSVSVSCIASSFV